MENCIFCMIAEGKTLTADVLCAEYRRLNEMYFGPDMIVDDEIAMEWARIPHFYYNYYVFQYATGYSAAIALSQKILKEGAPAVEKYLEFLSGGRSKPPVELLKGEYLITNCENSGPSSMDMLRQLLWEAFGFVPDKIAQTNSIGAQLLMVRSRHGVAIVPGFMREIDGEEFVKYPIPGNKIVKYNLMMLSDNTNPIANYLMQFRP